MEVTLLKFDCHFTQKIMLGFARLLLFFTATKDDLCTCEAVTGDVVILETLTCSLETLKGANKQYNT